MKKIRLRPLALILLSGFLMTACSRNDKNSQAQLQVRLTDNPTADVKEVWVDIQQVEVIVNDQAPVILGGAHPGIYNLLDLTNGKDTLLADAMIPAGNISQIRLVLGDNNYIVTHAGEKLPLKTPSAQQSGLKVQVHQAVSGGILYRLILDFDVSRSIVQAGNSGNIILKPVLRILSLSPSGGNIRGVVVPGSVLTAVIALNGIDTVASTFTAVPSGNYLLKDLPAGNYSLSFVPSDASYKTTLRNSSVILGNITVADTVFLQH